jgi:protein-L-isoaspartate O-methyltransferase
VRVLLLLLGFLCLAAEAQEDRPAPFITTPDDVVERMLRFAGTGPQDFVIDLGSGDGRFVIAAARQFGARSHGIELDPQLVEKSRQNARAAGVADRATFQQGDVLVADISPATVVTVYLLPSLLYRLQARFLQELKPGTRVVSHAFPLLSWKPDRSETMRIAKPHAGQGDESTMFLWIVPAEVRGTWRGEGRTLRIHQNYQDIEVEGAARATLQGRDIAWEADGARYRARVEGNRMTGEMERGGEKRPFTLTR